MTDQTAPATDPQIDADGVSPDSGASGTPEADIGSQRVNKEARYRVERNEARTERDALAERVQRMQRTEVERVAGEHLAQAGDLFTLSGKDLAEYLTESGDVDTAKVSTDVAALLAERPGLRKSAPAFDPTQGTGGPPKPMAPTPSWGTMFQTGTPSVPQFHR
ncbi:hypothetical protein R4227_22265 [Gordonia amicalis]|uniref:Scaffolding protein n=1 Tax=Gordonia amicalis TaxID=89053 RepID=A0ABU4DLZ0_9ACTN|nr:hypothetical protein [Gordonia amicalis]MDV6310264.1 hypothetical protein [Gordonia amicalis]MDV7102744.1 hypothetical protein [Gordonia amicalis]